MSRPMFVSITPDFKPGDPPPHRSAYTHWHEWAEVQHKAGLRQERCVGCDRFFFPQELSDIRKTWTAKTRGGKTVTFDLPVCRGCALRAT